MYNACTKLPIIYYQPENLNRPLWRPQIKWQKNTEVNLKKVK